MRGFRPNKEAKKSMGNSEVLIFPTQWYEVFLMTIIAAYSVGTPAIVSDIGNIGSIVKEGITGSKDLICYENYHRKSNKDEMLRTIKVGAIIDWLEPIEKRSKGRQLVNKR